MLVFILPAAAYSSKPVAVQEFQARSILCPCAELIFSSAIGSVGAAVVASAHVSRSREFFLRAGKAPLHRAPLHRAPPPSTCCAHAAACCRELFLRAGEAPLHRTSPRAGHLRLRRRTSPAARRCSSPRAGHLRLRRRTSPAAHRCSPPRASHLRPRRRTSPTTASFSCARARLRSTEPRLAPATCGYVAEPHLLYLHLHLCPAAHSRCPCRLRRLPGKEATRTGEDSATRPSASLRLRVQRRVEGKPLQPPPLANATAMSPVHGRYSLLHLHCCSNTRLPPPSVLPKFDGRRGGIAASVQARRGRTPRGHRPLSLPAILEAPPPPTFLCTAAVLPPSLLYCYRSLLP